MASYADDHATYAEEQEVQRNSQGSSSRLDRQDPLLAALFTNETQNTQAAPTLFLNLAQALQDRDTGEHPMLREMINHLLQEASSHETAKGVSQEFLDGLDRVSTSSLAQDDSCAICTTPYLDDKYPLVVRLRCGHRFDLDCVSVWLKLHTTCPMCRADVRPPSLPILEDSEEEYDDTYG